MTFKPLANFNRKPNCIIIKEYRFCPGNNYGVFSETTKQINIKTQSPYTITRKTFFFASALSANDNYFCIYMCLYFSLSLSLCIYHRCLVVTLRFLLRSINVFFPPFTDPQSTYTEGCEGRVMLVS